jgi:hypothetical protein
MCVVRNGAATPNEARVRSFSVGAAAAELLLVFASTVILDLESSRINTYIVSDSRLPNMDVKVLIFISPRNKVA